jgi:hypothetical protein
MAEKTINSNIYKFGEFPENVQVTFIPASSE